MTTQTSDRLKTAVARFKEAQDAEVTARHELYAAILADLAAGARQVDVVKTTGYTREHIRQLVIAAKEAEA